MSGQLKGDETIDQLRQIIGQMRQDIEWLMQGRLSSKNIREVGGYNVNQTDLVSKDGNVGLSSANDTADPVRLYAGNSNKSIAPWRVTQAGKMHATGATIESRTGYPKVELDPSGNMFRASSDATHSVSMIPNFTSFGDSPTLLFVDGSEYSGILQGGGELLIGGLTNIRIAPDGFFATIFLDALVEVPSFSAIVDASTGNTLQDALNNLQAQIDALS